VHLVYRHRALGLATGLFLVTTAFAAGLAFAGSTLDDRRYAVPLLGLLVLTGVVALFGWAAERSLREEKEVEHLEAAAEQARREAEALDEADRLGGELRTALAAHDADTKVFEEVESELRARVEGLEHALPQERQAYEARLDRQAQELSEERRLRTGGEEALRVAREWTAHIRTQVAVFERERGPLADPAPLRPILLRAATTLAGASRGLLAIRPEPGAELGILCQEGFETGSDVAVRAARVAVERRAPARDGGGALAAVSFHPPGGPEGAVVVAVEGGTLPVHPDDALVALGTAIGDVLHDLRVRETLRAAFLATIGVLTASVEAKDRYLLGHAEDVASCVAAVADRLGLEPARRERLVYGALLHDVGKVAISERILLKPAELTPEERSVIQLHPSIGAHLVRQVPALEGIEPGVLHHHERWDGGGYPEGLLGEAIPVEARILAVADAFCAMTADRPYRAALSLDEACAELERCAATQFDPVCVRLFVEEVRRRPPAAFEQDALSRALADVAPGLGRRLSRLARLVGSPFAA
jgi:HD-GYP domain-containing protein (c-di-GMP phosphodiesterase class II)